MSIARNFAESSALSLLATQPALEKTGRRLKYVKRLQSKRHRERECSEQSSPPSRRLLVDAITVKTYQNDPTLAQ